MARQRYLNTDFWRDDYIENLDPLERFLFIYCLTNPLTNIAGIYKISLKRMAFETGLDQDMIKKLLDRFKKEHKIMYYDGYIVIKNFIKHQKLNPKIKIGMDDILKEAPDEIIIWITGKPYKGLESFIKALNYVNVNDNINDNVNSNVNPQEETFPQEKKNKQKTTTKFIKPSIDELKKYIDEKKYQIDPQRFFNYYESKGWLVGKSPMKNWKAAIGTWHSNYQSFQNKQKQENSLDTEEIQRIANGVEEL